MLLEALQCLSSKHKTSLRAANILDIDTLLLLPPTDIARKCRITAAEADNIVKVVCRARPMAPTSTLSSLLAKEASNVVFTTGDEMLDEAIGGGMRTGMVWEICGESAAGKTQLALQLSLLVQLSESEGGLSGSVCYLTTRRTLPTERLLQIAHTHPSLSSSLPGKSCLTNIYTRATPDSQQLLYVLSTGIHTLIGDLKTSHQPPLRLLVIDTLAEIFHDASRTSTQSLVQRAQTLNLAGSALHAVARTHGVCVLVLNEVSDVFTDYTTGEPGELLYRDHARWFSRADGTIPGVDRKEAALGLAWANQPNTRIMLSRTERRRYLDFPSSPVTKRRRLDDTSYEEGIVQVDGPSLIRRLSVIFSTVGPTAGIDYIVTAAGVSALPPDADQPTDMDARSDVYSDFEGMEDQDLINALAEVEGLPAPEAASDPAVQETPDVSDPVAGEVELDVLEAVALEQFETVLKDKVVPQLDVTLDEENLLALEEDGPAGDGNADQLG